MKNRIPWLTWLLGFVLLLSTGSPLAAAPVFPPIIPILRPDLTVTVDAPLELTQGQKLAGLVTLTVKNQGVVEAPGATGGTGGYLVDLVLTSDSTSVRLDRISTTPTLGHDQTATFNPGGTIPLDTPPGTYCLSGQVDPTNLVQEGNEENNTHCHSITITKRPFLVPITPPVIMPPLKPDLTVKVTAPTAMLQGEDISRFIKVTVTNQGIVNAPGSKTGQPGYEIDLVLSKKTDLPVAYAEESVTFKDGALLIGGRVSTTSDLPAGGVVEYPVHAVIPADTPIGTYCLGAIVDPGGRVGESNESNNTYCHTIEVKKYGRVIPLPEPITPTPAPPPPPLPTDPVLPLPPIPVPPLPTPPLPLPPLPMDPLPLPPVDPIPPKTCTTQKFSDLPINHRACAAVSLLVSKGIVNGFEDGTFRPERSVTRAEFAKMYILTLGLEPDPHGRLPFTDIEGHWAALQGYLGTAVTVGAINGFPDRTFRPDDLVTRAQGMKIVTADLLTEPFSYPAGMPTDITTDTWYRPHVGVGIKNALMGPASHYSLFAEATFSGDTPMTRAEAALLLANRLVLGDR